MQSINDIVNAINNLPEEEQEKIRGLLLQDERDKKTQLQKQLKNFAKAKKWIDENREKYLNQWVCLEGDQLIAHSSDGREVYRIAREVGIKIPFIDHIVEEPKNFVGAWM